MTTPTVAAWPFGFQILDNTGKPVSGALVNAYVAGSAGATRQNTYINSGASPVANTNPVVADGFGRVSIFLDVSLQYEFVVTDPTGAITYLSEDYVQIVSNTSASTISQWEPTTPLAAVYVSTTSFTLTGNQTTNFSNGTRIKALVTAGTVYGTVISSAYSTFTTITVVLDNSANLDSGLTTVQYGLLSGTNTSKPVSFGNTPITIASASTVDLGSAPTTQVIVSGVNTIGSFGSAPIGTMRWVRFTGSLTVTYNVSTMILPQAQNLIVGPGDSLLMTSLGSSSWICTNYFPINPATTSNVTPGTLIAFAGQSVPAGYLQCPAAPGGGGLVLRTSYPNLFAAIGTTYGAGNGVTTFQIPWFPVGYGWIQLNGTNYGAYSVGAVIAHTHTYDMAAARAPQSGNSTPCWYADQTVNTGSTGGAANYGAGGYVMMCVKY